MLTHTYKTFQISINKSRMKGYDSTIYENVIIFFNETVPFREKYPFHSFIYLWYYRQLCLDPTNKILQVQISLR